MEKVNKTIQVWVLDQDTKNEIKESLYKALEDDYSSIEVDEHVENGMDSRLCDLEETIDIYSLETINI